MFQHLGDPVTTFAGQYATSELKQRIREALGMDKPFYVQYAVYLRNVFRGDFGRSYLTQLPVLTMILERLPASLELALAAVVLSAFLGISLGVACCFNPRSVLSQGILTLSLLGISAPTFLVGVLYILLFSVTLGVLPTSGRGALVPVVGYWSTGLITASGLRHLILPSFTLAMYNMAVLVRLTRSGMLKALAEDYTRTAWAKGLPRRLIFFRHALRNAAIPVVTVLGIQLASLISFSVVTESIFQWPGAGQLLIRSIHANDQPIIIAYVMMSAVFILSINLAVDVLYGLLNPRVMYD